VLESGGLWCSAETDVEVPLEKAWQLWEDRELIPKWMPWIRSVTVQPDDPKLSKWLLSTRQFGRNWEFSWLAQNLTPMQHQKVRGTTSHGGQVLCMQLCCMPSLSGVRLLLRRSTGDQYQARQAMP
jgi:uncharacterized membrane protein